MTLQAVDLCPGLGGWSDGLALEGFEVIGVEIEPKIAKLYKHPVIVADIRTLNGSRFKNKGLMVGSPPCRDFTRVCDHGHRPDGTDWKWKEPKNPQRGLETVHAFLRIVDEAQPKFWLMENVPGLIKHVQIRPQCTARLSRTMIRSFWGNFPPFLIPSTLKGTLKCQIHGPYRSWERARIPLPVARALGRAVREALGNEPTN